jgi:hypothetical protein
VIMAVTFWLVCCASMISILTSRLLSVNTFLKIFSKADER